MNVRPVKTERVGQMDSVLSAIIPVQHAWVHPTINVRLVPMVGPSKMEYVSSVIPRVPNVMALDQLTVLLVVPESLLFKDHVSHVIQFASSVPVEVPMSVLSVMRASCW